MRGGVPMLLRHPVWFRFLRFRCRGGKRREAYNRALEVLPMGYVLGQQTCPDFRVGAAHMNRVGCEIAAVYNALRLCGQELPCAEIIRVFEEEGYLMGALTVGDLGADPYAIGEFFTGAGVAYTRYADFDTMCTAADGSRGCGGVFIASFWNRRRIWGGLHTVAFCSCRTDRLLHVFNFHGNDPGILMAEHFSALTDKKRFITGYKVGLYPA